MKPLSEMLKEIEPKKELIMGLNKNESLTTREIVDYVSYEKLRSVAIKLAKALEKLKYKQTHVEHVVEVNFIANEAIAHAEEIIGDQK